MFIIEVEKPLKIEIIDYINKHIKDAFPDMKSISATCKVRNINYDDMINLYTDSINYSTLTKPMKALFKEKKVSINQNILNIEMFQT